MDSIRTIGRAVKGRSSRSRGFTLLELMIVLALLTITVGLAIPRLASFFRGRALDSEARRMLAFTRFAHDRATSEGIPMRVWFDAKAGKCGMERDATYQDIDSSEQMEIMIDPAITLEVTAPQQASRSTRPVSPATTLKPGTHSNLPAIEFMPDGTIGSSSPDRVVLRDNEDHSMVLSRSENRLTYELSAR